MSINEELSFTEYTLTEDTTDFIISFDRIGGSTDEVSILVNNTPIEDLVGYTVTQVNFNTWRVEPALTTGTVVRLVRTTNLDTMVYVFTAGSKFIAKNIDDNFKQIQHSQQEARDSQDKLQADVNALFLDIQDVRDQVEQAVETANSASALAIATADAIADTNLIVQSEGSQMVTLSDSTIVPNMNKRIEDASGGLIPHNILQNRDVAEAHPASAISDASGVTQQEINDLTGAPYRVKVGGYNIGERVVLANGDIVKSTIDGNTNDPNVDMTGWISTRDASFVVYHSISQKKINDGFESIAEITSITAPVNKMRVKTKSYHAPNFIYAKPYVGGGTYVYNASLEKSKHNGGTVIAHNKPFPTDWTVRADVEEWFTAPLLGTGCWELIYEGAVNTAHFGTMGNFNLGVDNSIAVNKALAVKNSVVLPEGNFIIHRPILTDKAFPIIKGAGGESTLLTVENVNWQGVTFKGKAYNAAIVVTSGVQGSWIEGATLEDFSLLGNSYTADGKIGIDFDNVCLKVNVSNVNISAFDKGIHTFKSWVHSYNNVTVTDCITNSMHFDTFANGYSLTGVCLYGRSVKTLCHLKFANACYGNSFNGGAIEHCWIGVSTRNNAQVNITGVDWEVIDQLFMESVDCVGLPSKIDTCSIMGNPSQSGFGVTNGQLIVENNKIFNPLGSQNMDAPIYFAGGTGGIVANNNEYGAHTTLIGGAGKVTGTDVGRLDFSKSRRITDGKILDAYSETYQAYFNFYTNTLDVYQSVSGTVLKTQVGNTYKARINTLLVKYAGNVGDYFTFQFSELSNVQGVVGVFAFSPSNNLLGTDCITGQVICNNGTCYLMKSVGGLLTKAALNTTTDTNLFSLSLSYTDTI